MIRIFLICLTLIITGCGDSIEPTRTTTQAKKPWEKNATDAVGVAKGDEQVSPFGKPAH